LQLLGAAGFVLIGAFLISCGFSTNLQSGSVISRRGTRAFRDHNARGPVSLRRTACFGSSLVRRAPTQVFRSFPQIHNSRKPIILRSSQDNIESEELPERDSIGKLWRSYGHLHIVNGTLELKGQQGKILEFEGGAKAQFVWERSALYYVYLLPGSIEPSIGEKVYMTEEATTFPVGDSLKGKTVNMFGQSQGEPVEGEQWRIFNDAPQQQDLQTIRKSLLTGVTAVDALAPMGMGQNMLLIGHKGTGKTSLAINTALAQKMSGVRVVYANLKGQVDEVSRMLAEGGALDYTTIVVPEEGATPDSEASAEEKTIRKVIAASTAVSIAEHARAKGENALVIIDDLEGHKDMWRFICETLLDSAGGFNVFQGADDSSMRQFYSSLFQRVGKFNNAKGAGSLSMMMVLESTPPPEAEKKSFTLEDFENELVNDQTRDRIKLLIDKGVDVTVDVLEKLNIPAPGTRTVETLASIQDTDALISLSDGHIIFDEKAFKSGRRPAIDPSNSLTRVGIGTGIVQGQAFAPVIKKVTPRLRLDIAQMVQDHDQVAGETLQNRITAWMAVMTQENGEVRSIAEQAATLYAVGRGRLDKVAMEGGIQGVKKSVAKFWEHAQSEIPGVISEIQETQDISQSGMETLARTIDVYYAPEKELAPVA